MEYEWYYLDSIGVYEGQYAEYQYADTVPSVMEGARAPYCMTCHRAAAECQCPNDDGHVELPLGVASDDYDEALYEVKDRRGTVAVTEGEHAIAVIHDTVEVEIGGRRDVYPICYTVTQTKEDGPKASMLTETGAMTGGAFCPCTVVTVIDGLLTFGTTNGVLCAFNTDKREENGMIRPRWYTFDGRTIFSGVATKMDNCGVPHLNKTTVKKSTVIKMKNLASMGAKVKVRTNRRVFHETGRLAGGRLLFDDLDFSSFVFSVDGQSLFAVKEKEKKWVEKQFFVYSDSYRKPFALFYLSYSYRFAGRFKEKEVT